MWFPGTEKNSLIGKLNFQFFSFAKYLDCESLCFPVVKIISMIGSLNVYTWKYIMKSWMEMYGGIGSISKSGGGGA